MPRNARENLVRSRPLARSARITGASVPSMIPSMIARPENAQHIACHRRELDASVLERFLQSLNLKSSLGDPRLAIARIVIQFAPFPRWNEAPTHQVRFDERYNRRGVSDIGLAEIGRASCRERV